jgi:hypothetical protein
MAGLSDRREKVQNFSPTPRAENLKLLHHTCQYWYILPI